MNQNSKVIILSNSLCLGGGINLYPYDHITRQYCLWNRWTNYRFLRWAAVWVSFNLVTNVAYRGSQMNPSHLAPWKLLCYAVIKIFRYCSWVNTAAKRALTRSLKKIKSRHHNPIKLTSAAFKSQILTHRAPWLHSGTSLTRASKLCKIACKRGRSGHHHLRQHFRCSRSKGRGHLQRSLNRDQKNCSSSSDCHMPLVAYHCSICYMLWNKSIICIWNINIQYLTVKNLRTAGLPAH